MSKTGVLINIGEIGYYFWLGICPHTMPEYRFLFLRWVQGVHDVPISIERQMAQKIDYHLFIAGNFKVSNVTRNLEVIVLYDRAC